MCVLYEKKIGKKEVQLLLEEPSVAGTVRTGPVYRAASGAFSGLATSLLSAIFCAFTRQCTT